MPEVKTFDYYYGDESSQFSFYRIPRQLVTGEQFKGLSTDAKLLYGLLLDRMGLSAKNGWYDELGRVFIYYTLEEIQADLGCAHDKATKLLVDLDSGKGVGLIERKKQGQGKPTRIYAKRFTTQAIPPQPTAPQGIPRLPLFSIPDCGKSAVQTAEKPQSRVRESRSLDCGKTASSYTESNQTDFSQLNLSIHPSVSPLAGLTDGYDCRAEVKENIEYDALCREYSREDVDEIVELMAETLCTTRPRQA
ncbi:MAG: replication initiator protein A [Pseudoflavonifractor sp.]